MIAEGSDWELISDQNCPTRCDEGRREMGLVARGVHSPPFSRRGGCAIKKKIPFLSGADGWFVNSNQNKVRYADIYKEAARPFTNRPVCASKERDLLLRRSHPSLKTAGLASIAVIDFLGHSSVPGAVCSSILNSLPRLQFIHNLEEEGGIVARKMS